MGLFKSCKIDCSCMSVVVAVNLQNIWGQALPLVKATSMSSAPPAFLILAFPCLLLLFITLLRRPDIDDALEDPSIPETSHCWLHPDVPCPPLPYTDGILKDILLDPDGVVENDGVPHSIHVSKSSHSLDVCKLMVYLILSMFANLAIIL